MREHATESRLSEHLLFCAFNALVTCCPVLLRSRKSDVGKKKKKRSGEIARNIARQISPVNLLIYRIIKKEESSSNIIFQMISLFIFFFFSVVNQKSKMKSKFRDFLLLDKIIIYFSLVN